jgi:hypothetical protein
MLMRGLPPGLARHADRAADGAQALASLGEQVERSEPARGQHARRRQARRAAFRAQDRHAPPSATKRGRRCLGCSALNHQVSRRKRTAALLGGTPLREIDADDRASPDRAACAIQVADVLAGFG